MPFRSPAIATSMIIVSERTEIIGIIAEGELLEQGEQRATIAELLEQPAGDYDLAVVRVPRTDRAALRGRVRIFASSLHDERVERTVELVETLTPSVEPPSVETLLQSRRNAGLRARFMAKWPTLTSAEVAERSGSKAANRAAAANRWRQVHRIFAVRYRNELRYPAFQFDDDGQPRPEIQSVLEAFAERHASDWEVALWFTTPHPRTRRPPAEMLDDEPERVDLLVRQSLDIPQ